MGESGGRSGGPIRRGRWTEGVGVGGEDLE